MLERRMEQLAPDSRVYARIGRCKLATSQAEHRVGLEGAGVLTLQTAGSCRQRAANIPLHTHTVMHGLEQTGPANALGQP